MRRRQITSPTLVIVLSLFILTDCGGPDDDLDRDIPAAPPPMTAPDPLVLRLESPASVTSRDPVQLRLILENRGETPIEVGLEGNPIAFDFVIQNPDGRRVWRRLEGVAIDAILWPRVLSAGEEVAFAHSWDQRDDRGRIVPPGPYLVRGILPVADAAEGWGTEARRLEIRP